MSTDLFGIRVLKLMPEENKVQIKVFVVYYDPEGEYHDRLPLDHSFF